MRKLIPAEVQILRLLQRAEGPVAQRLIEYDIWISKRRKVPQVIHPYISYIRRITGLGIVKHADAGWILAPELNAPWCEPEKWDDPPGE